MNRIYTNDGIIKEVQKLANRLGRAPTSKDISKADGLPCTTIIQRRFGSIRNLLDMAGLTLIRAHSSDNPWTEEEIINGLQKFAKENGRSPRAKDLANGKYDYLPSLRTVVKKFSGWSNALKAAGLTPNKRGGNHNPFGKSRIYSDQQIIGYLQELALELGQTPTRLDAMYPSAVVIERRFGTWNNALMAAGLEPRRIRGPKKAK